MDIEVTNINGIEIFSLSGRLDLSSAASLKEQFDIVLGREARRFHFNFEHVKFINSFGLGILLSISKDIRISKGRMTFSNLNGYVSEVFDQTQLTRILEIYPTEDEAINSYHADITTTGYVTSEQHI